MKPGYKIIIAGLLVYGGLKIKATMDVAPYKERAVQFAGLLKQQKSFDAQALLSTPLQNTVSIEALNTLIDEQNLTQSKELAWSDWRGEEGNYTLFGAFVFANERRLPVEFSVVSPQKNGLWIQNLKIGSVNLGGSEKNNTGFLEIP